MLGIELIGHDFRYEVDEIVKNLDSQDLAGFEVVSTLEIGSQLVAKAEVFEGGKLASEAEVIRDNENFSELEMRKVSKRMVKMSLFKALKKFFNKDIPWGILTGIRPTKIVHEMIEKGLKREAITGILTSDYEISSEKAELAINIAEKEVKVIKNTPRDSISLYIGIPFCPTRCLYCSFTSNSMEKYSHIMDSYVDALIKEIDAISGIIKANGWIVQSIYFGGGTPTSLNVEQMENLLEKVDLEFNINEVQEVTFEAGRPDTITKEKLELIKNYGIERISINPQTMNGETLKKIKRNHSPEDIVESFKIAREVSFENINMDIIVGLPDENEEHVRRTMDELLKLDPDNLTVHTMAVKRASRLNENIDEYQLSEARMVQNMLEITQDYAKKMGMYPYYMYRQKNILGNFENVGYCKHDKESIYNIQIMEEKQTIVALGAGGISKVVDLEKDRIERIFNVKNVEEYIKRIDEMIGRKMVLKN